MLPILRYDDIADVIARANNSEFGLGGTVWGKERITSVAARSIFSRMLRAERWTLLPREATHGAAPHVTKRLRIPARPFYTQRFICFIGSPERALECGGPKSRKKVPLPQRR